MTARAICLNVILPAKDKPFPVELDPNTTHLLEKRFQNATGSIEEVAEEALSLGLQSLLATSNG